MHEDAVFVGVTDSVEAVRELAGRTPEGMMLAIDLDLMGRQAAMIAGEDKHLAATIVRTVVALTEAHTDLTIDLDTGHCRQAEPGEDDEETTFLRGAVVGNASCLLQMLRVWPGDPLGLDGLDIFATEARVSDLWVQSAERLGVQPTIL